MRYILIICFFLILPIANVFAQERLLSVDTSDPLYHLSLEETLSETFVIYTDDVIRFQERLSYGLNDRLSIGAALYYQRDFNDNRNGFSPFDISLSYRSSNIDWLNDIIVGLKFDGAKYVQFPYGANNTYYAGIRFGRQLNTVTFAGTIITNWFFDDSHGLAYIDLSPDVYFRINGDIRLGLGGIFRKATDEVYNEEWLTSKIVAQYGKTQYAGLFRYAFEKHDIYTGVQINLLF